MITNNNNNNVFDFYVFQMFLWRKVIITISLSFEISLNKYFENMYADCLLFCNLTTLKKKNACLRVLTKSQNWPAGPVILKMWVFAENPYAMHTI